MKKKLNRMLAMLLALTIVLGMVPVYAAEATGFEEPAVGTVAWLSETGTVEDFPLAADGKAATIWYNNAETTPVTRVIGDLQQDVERVTGVKPAASTDSVRPEGPVILVGTLEGNPEVSALLTEEERAVIEGQWEAYTIKVVDENTLVVAGADQRGAIFGVYELSERMGVSPWYYFADVPVQTKDSVYIKAGTVLTDMPDVQYRGIFLNDEEKLSRWVSNVFNPANGGSGVMGAEIYARIFELILRLKGNYIWAAMHVNSINNIPANIDTVQEYGIVLGSSHCDMLLRTNVHEWDNWARSKGYSLDYDYTTNKNAVLEYWRENVVRHQNTEAQWTLGMRGKHDEGFNTAKIMDAEFAYLGDSKAERQANLLSEIIEEQQKILKEVLGEEKYEKAFKALIPYKEVLDIYNHPSFHVSDDVTIIWCDDNHGMVRKSPTEVEYAREGGSGLYYHVSYWAPADQSYLWMSSLPLSVMGEELNKCLKTGIRKSWVLNVGDMKPQEGEMEYFIRCGWDGENTTKAKEFSADWMARNFGNTMSEATTKEVADILNTFYQHTNVRKVDHMRLDIFEQVNYNEWDKRMEVYQDLYERAAAVAATLDSDQRTAFYELVQCKINWAYLTNKAFYFAEKSNLAYDQGRMASADNYSKLSILTDESRRDEIAYYSKIAGGKWNLFIDPENHAPPVTTQRPGTNPALVIEGAAALGVVVQGEALPVNGASTLNFSHYDLDGKFIDVFNKGTGVISWTAEADQTWVKLSKTAGTFEDEDRLWVNLDGAPVEGGTAVITIKAGSVTKTVNVTVAPKAALPADFEGYVEADGYVSMQAEHYNTISGGANDAKWETLVNAGRGFDGDMMRCWNPARKAIENTADAPCLTYDFYLTSEGTFPLEIYRLPTMNAVPGGQLRFAVSVDGGEPIVVSSTAVDEGTTSNQNKQWVENLFRQIEKHIVELPALTAGKHTLKLYMVDNLIAIDKMVLYTNGMNPSALGPDESYHTVYNTGADASVAVLDRADAYTHAEAKNEMADWGTGAFLEDGGKVSIEAEYAMENVLTSRTEITDDMSAYTVSNQDVAVPEGTKGGYNAWRLTQSDTGFGVRLPDAGYTWDKQEQFEKNAPELTYKVDFATLGTYSVWVRWRLVDNNGDSIRGGVNHTLNGSSFKTNQLWSYDRDEHWYWENLGTVKVTQGGVQPFHLWMREDGLYLDRIYLTTGSETPSDGAWEVSIRGGASESDVFRRELEAKKAEIARYSYPIGDAVGCYDEAAYSTLLTAIQDAENLVVTGSITEVQADEAIRKIDDAWKALAKTQHLGDYYAFRDFENDQLDLYPFGFEDIKRSEGATVAIQEENGNRYLHLATTNNDKFTNLRLPYAEKVTATADERIVIEMNARFFGGQFASIALAYGSNNQQAIFTAFDNASSKHQISVIHGGSKKDSGSFHYGQWYNFKIVADMAAQTYQVYMDGKLLSHDGGDPVYKFRNGVTDLVNHTLGIDNFANVQADFDDIRVSVVDAAEITDITGRTLSIYENGTAASETVTQGSNMDAVVEGMEPAAYLLTRTNKDGIQFVWNLTRDGETTQIATGNTYVPTAADVDGVLTVTAKGVGSFIGSTVSVGVTVLSADEGSVANGAELRDYANEKLAALNLKSIPVGSGLGCYGVAEYYILVKTLNNALALADKAPSAEAVANAKADIDNAWTALDESLNLGDYYAYRDFSGDTSGKMPYGFDVDIQNGSGSGYAVVEESGNRFLRLTTDPSSGQMELFLPYSELVTPAKGQQVAIEYSVRFVNDACQYLNGAMVWTNGGNGKDSAMVTAFDNGGYNKHEHNFKVHYSENMNNTSVQKPTTMKFEPGVWYDVKMLGDWEAGTYTVYVNGEKQAQRDSSGTVLRDAFKFRQKSGTGLRGQRFGSDNRDGIFDYDNFKVYIASPTDVLSVEPVEGFSAPLGTVQDALDFPETVTVTLGDGSTREVAVSQWTCASYDADQAGTYTFIGALTMPEGITNSKNLTASVKITLSKMKIACVGDSITYGSNGKGGQVAIDEQYPSQLAALFNGSYTVKNFGVSGATMVANGSDSAGATKGYAKLDAYVSSLNDQPNVVVMMLGTNDSKGLNWDNYKTDYVRDALKMIEDYQSLKSNPKIYIASSPTVIAGDNSYGIQADVVDEQIVYLQRQIALAAGVSFIDVHEATKDATVDQFPDKVHGNKDGYKMIAEAVKAGIEAPAVVSNIASVEPAEVETLAGYAPELPLVTVTYEDGTKGVASVDWDLTGVTFDEVGTVEVAGTLTGLEIEAVLTVTVTEGKLATAIDAVATSRESANPDKNVIDDDLGTRWAASGAQLPESVVIELDGVYTLDHIAILWYNNAAGNRSYQYNVQVSTDGENYTQVVDRSHNGRSDLVMDSIDSAEAKFVKITVTGKNGGSASIWEVDLFGVKKEEGKTYTVTIADMVNGTVTADKAEAQTGETVTLTVMPDEGYQLVEGSLKVNGEVIEGSTFEMPAEDVTVTAEFEALPKPVDKTELADLVAKAEKLLEDNYTADSWNTFQTALTDAKSVLDHEKATQEEVDTVKTALEAAIDGLTEKPVIKEETIVVKAVVDGDKANAKTIYTGNAPHGTNVVEWLNENVQVEDREGYAMDQWYMWDWYGHKFNEKRTVDGWTNVYVTFTKMEQIYVKGVIGGDQANAKVLWHGYALKGTNLVEFLNENAELKLPVGCTWNGEWMNWDWYGHKFSEKTTVNGWTNVYVDLEQHEVVTVVVKAVINDDKSTAKTIWTGKAPKGVNLVEWLDDNAKFEVYEGYDWSGTWRNWDWFGHVFSSTAKFNGYTNVYVDFTQN